MEPTEETIEGALLGTLDDLTEENFKRFKNKLAFLKMEGSAGIPWSKLQKADTIDTSRLLLEAFGEEVVQEVVVRILRSVHLQDSATRFQKWKHHDCRKKYKRHIRKVLESVPEMGSHPGPVVRLSQRYTQLLLRRKPVARETAHEILIVERKHREIEVHPENRHEVGMQDLFEPDAQGESSKTVVLLGPAGVGKTTVMWKLMLDWASGTCWQEKFEYIFYISCRAIDSIGRPVTMADLLCSQCPPGTPLTEGTLMSNNNILILVDNFDALQHCSLPVNEASSDPSRKQSASALVMDLLSRKLLAKSHLIVSVRPVSVGPLLSCLRSPRFVEVMGFCPDQRKEYFCRFFGDEKEATQAFEVVRSNETLFSMCFLPVLCWVICSIFRHESQRDLLEDLPGPATVTETHLRLIFSFLGCHSWPSSLDGLCSLAKDGVLRKTMFFDEEVLREHNLSCTDLEPLSADGTVLCQAVQLAPRGRFIHLSFQEFFAALFYLLDMDGNTETSMRGLKDILGNKDCSGRYCMLLRFLCGLSNPRRLSVLEKAWGCKISRPGPWQELLRWLQQEAKLNALRKGPQLLELCHCIYEVEDHEFRDSIMGHVDNLDLQDQLCTKLDFAALSFCLPGVQSLRSLRLSGYGLGPVELKQLLPGLLKASEIQMNRCGLTAVACKDLAAVLVTNPNLTTLDLSENPLGDLGISHLHGALADSPCTIQCLRLQLCSLTAAACEPLSRVLASNPGLTELELGQNHLGDEGCAKLCEGLKHLQCRLQRLTLHLCHLTDAACEALDSVLETSETLLELGLGDNALGNPGVRQLCAALKRPGCKLQRLALTMKNLNSFTQKKLKATCAARPELILTSYYLPGYPAFPGDK